MRQGRRFSYLYMDVKEVDMSISLKNDYSFLFSGMNKSVAGTASDMSWLSDYASIKSGSYGKLMKSYYSSVAGDKKNTAEAGSKDSRSSVLESLTSVKTQTPTASKETKAYNKAATAADALQSSIKDLGSLKEDADDDKVFEALSGYVKNYNSVVDTASATADKSIGNRLDSIKSTTSANEKDLASLGISVGKDGKLSIDKDQFAAGDKSKVQTLFADRRSYASNVNVSAAMIQSTAGYDAARANTYTAAGAYSAVTGSLWDSTT